MSRIYRRFKAAAVKMVNMEIANRANSLGGYGKNGEVIYTHHPYSCPSDIVNTIDNASFCIYTNGSTNFSVELADGKKINVLRGHFDKVEKRQIGVPSQNIWLNLNGKISSLINKNNNILLEANSCKIIKLRNPNLSMWFTHQFAVDETICCNTAVEFSFTYLEHGPALVRNVYIHNKGSKLLEGSLWTSFHLNGTQFFEYDKEAWYDAGMPLSECESIVRATVPSSDVIQVKRVSSAVSNMKCAEATCDYMSFVGDSSSLVMMPTAVRQNRLCPKGAGGGLNRFASTTLAANHFEFSLEPNQEAVCLQTLQYITAEELLNEYKKAAFFNNPDIEAVTFSFRRSGEIILAVTPDAENIVRQIYSAKNKVEGDEKFFWDIPSQKLLSEYINSIWTNVKALYKNCRAHGAKLADGIELGTRDRGQDMWPMLKEDPQRVVKDLKHAFSFLFRIKSDDEPWQSPLTLRQKLHGMFPRQYPSQWNDRSQAIYNDNRPYIDSPLWLIDSLCMLITETGDSSLLSEKVRTVTLKEPDYPETSSIVGTDLELYIAEVVIEIFDCFRRHVEDSPYGLSQIIYGGWCDPVVMFGTNKIADFSTVGYGRGVNTRLTAHLFLSLVEFIDVINVDRIGKTLELRGIDLKLDMLKKLASEIRDNMLKVAWEEASDDGYHAGFITYIHELKKDGSVPDYNNGEIGYTLGSTSGSDFDGNKRRELTAQAYGLAMLCTERDYLKPIKRKQQMVEAILQATNEDFFDSKLGLMLFTVPFGNNQAVLDYCGRVGALTPGGAENGEYHHAQTFMHYFRLLMPGQADMVWEQMKPIMSVLADESIAGPFDMPSNSFFASPGDPHYGSGMHFGLTGSMDWIIEIVHKFIGLQLNLHKADEPVIKVEPNLPLAFENNLTFKRLIYHYTANGSYREVPLCIKIKQADADGSAVLINGEPSDRAEIVDLGRYDRLEIVIRR